MNKVLIIFLGFFLFATSVQAQDLSNKLSGRILLQVENNGQAWYVEPKNKKRIFLGRPQDAFRIMQELGVGISEKDFISFQNIVPRRLAGFIVLRVRAHGEAYYINPVDLQLYYLGRPQDAFRIMSKFGLGIKNNDLLHIAIKDAYKKLVYKKDILGNNDRYWVDNVVDGDTIDVLMAGKNRRVRIIGLDTPETVSPHKPIECFGPEASKRAKEILFGKYVFLEKDSTQDEVDKYGRLLRHVFLNNGNSFAEIMIGEGLAREYTYRVAHKYQKEYRAVEDLAKQNKLGLWADEACKNFFISQNMDKEIIKKSFNSSIVISDIFYNGKNNPLEGDEYVEISNQGIEQNLIGYYLRDASKKVFVFPDIILSAQAKLKIFTGCGVNTQTELYWCHHESAIWNNDHDKASLYNKQEEVLASYEY